MGSFFIGIVKLITPWFTEWWKSLNLSTSSVRALREIHVMFIMHIALFAFFLASVDHGVSIYVNQIHSVNQQKHAERELEALRKQHEHLSTNYTQLLGVLERFAVDNPRGFNRVLGLPAAEAMRKEIRENE